MDNDKILKKGEHERAMVKARDMLRKGCGMLEITSETRLSQEDVLKEMRKMED